MRKGILILLATLGIANSVYSQETSDSTAPKEKKLNYHITAGISANYGSTNLTNEFIQKLLFGGRIEEGLKDRVLDKTNKRNRFGVELNYEFQFVDFKDTVSKNYPAGVIT